MRHLIQSVSFICHHVALLLLDGSAHVSNLVWSFVVPREFGSCLASTWFSYCCLAAASLLLRNTLAAITSELVSGRSGEIGERIGMCESLPSVASCLPSLNLDCFCAVPF